MRRCGAATLRQVNPSRTPSPFYLAQQIPRQPVRFTPSSRSLSLFTPLNLSYPTTPRFSNTQWNVSSSASSSKNTLPPPVRVSVHTRRRPNDASRNATKVGQASRAAQKGKAKTAPQEGDATLSSNSTSNHSSKQVLRSTEEKKLNERRSQETKSAPPTENQPPRSVTERIQGLWDNVKYLFRFYYNGIKRIWQDRQVVAELRKTIAKREAENKGGIQWLEKNTIELHHADLRKLPLFVAILIILEEILPLVVIYAPSLLPSTCVLPSQALKMRAEEERKRGIAIQQLASDTTVRSLVDRIDAQCSDVLSKGNVASAYGKSTGDQAPSKSTDESVDDAQSLRSLHGDVVKALATVFGLRAWGPKSLVLSRIQRHLDDLRKDDELLRSARTTKGTAESAGGQWEAIRNSPWLFLACTRRGLRSFEASPDSMEHNLEAYLRLTNSTDGASVSRVYHTFVPLMLYDGTAKHLLRLQSEASQDQSKGLRQRTTEVVESVVEAEKRKEAVKE